ncbi:hypothetical protein BRETT_000004 [Brettanomyces bruxellensis]|uniref:Uncharacterized protein n=1 Tax=Dekkera bruxellensis TaxID=5007 RepID=A0A871R098_DEKBR|nr:uncharacterized protein BRETT_000004 [Brettanomyces bruxellensis]QOU18286.1 hypothetical protein BRETT_000004 [Brettanomyces bruxellensis]
MHERLIFIDNNLDSTEFEKKCFTRITLETIEPEQKFERDEEMIIKFEVLMERVFKSDEAQEQEPVMKYGGHIEYSIDNYRFEICASTETFRGIYFVVKRKLNGIFNAVFSVKLKPISLNERDMDIMTDLYGEFKLNCHYRTLITNLEDKNRQLEKDFEESVKSKDIFWKTNENIRNNVEEIFIPMINQQRKIRRLNDKLGIKQNLNFSSIRSEQIINYQEPNKSIQFDLTKIEDISPKKNKGLKTDLTKHPSSPTKCKKNRNFKKERKLSISTQEEELTDKDSDNDDLFPSLHLSNNQDGSRQSSLQRMDSMMKLNEELDKEEDKKELFHSNSSYSESTSEKRVDSGVEDANETASDTETDVDEEPNKLSSS